MSCQKSPHQSKKHFWTKRNLVTGARLANWYCGYCGARRRARRGR